MGTTLPAHFQRFHFWTTLEVAIMAMRSSGGQTPEGTAEGRRKSGVIKDD